MKSSDTKGRWSTIGTSVSELEKLQIEERARQNGLSVCAYVKKRLLEDDEDRENIENLSSYQKKLYRVANRIFALSYRMSEQNLGSSETEKTLEEINNALISSGYGDE